MFLTAIILAAIGALGLAVGTHLQHRAVREGAARAVRGTNIGVARALTSPLWLFGMGIIVLQTVLNIIALGLAPVSLVQPVGSLALVCAVIISACALGVRVRRGLVIGISIAIASVATFIGISAGFARDVRPTEYTASLLTWLMLCLLLVGVLVTHRRAGHIVRVVSAGVVFGTVASAVHVVAVEVLALLRLGALAPSGAVPANHAPGSEDPVSAPSLWTLIFLLVAASVVGTWLVQTAYASGPPETVLAGLTVLDPLVAVLVGAFLLGEYSTIPLAGVLGLVLSGIAACVGIAVVVRHHPAIDNTTGAPARQIEAAPQTAFETGPADTDGIAIQS